MGGAPKAPNQTGFMAGSVYAEVQKALSEKGWQFGGSPPRISIFRKEDDEVVSGGHVEVIQSSFGTPLYQVTANHPEVLQVLSALNLLMVGDTPDRTREEPRTLRR